MVEDSLLVALIRESLDAPGRARRLAALALVEVLRKGDCPERRAMDVIEPAVALQVAEEVRLLARKYGLSSES